MRMRSLLVLAVVVGMPPLAGAATVPSVFGGKVACLPVAGVQFCAGTLATRVETWDGVPLDVNVTIPPAAMDGPLPLIVDLHGWGVGKAPQPFVQQALAGYVVLSYSARGFHASCGGPASRVPDPTLSNPNACNERGWIRLADARYEVRDTQHLAGLLADEGLVVPDRVGVTGASYGGGQSMMLAVLRDRVMLPDGTLVPWQSPGGLPMRIAAAAPVIPWSDLAYALTPNGDTLDHRTENPYGTRAGVQKQSWVNLLYTLGALVGFYAPPGMDPDADLPGWKARLDAGEPYDGDPLMEHILDEITTYHSAYYLDDSVEPAPLFIYNAFTDDLFPATEALRFWRKTRALYPSAEVSLQFSNGFGHPRASLGGDMSRFQTRVSELFARHLQGAGGPLPPLEVYTQACGGSTEQGPFAATDWDQIHPGEVRHAEAAAKAFDSAGGDPATAAAIDPGGAGGSSPCHVLPAADDPGAATYRLAPATGAGYTLAGSPTVIATLAADGFAQVAARLWDVAPDGNQALVTHGFYRPRIGETAFQVFQLPPNAWHFVGGHVAKLELLGQSANFGRPSNGTFTVTVANLELRLPVRETPGGVVQPPAPPVEPGAPPSPCPAAPASGCRVPFGAGRSRLTVRDAATDRLVWKWARGAATSIPDFDAPGSTTDYHLCVYGGDALLAALTAPAGPRWRDTPRGYRYVDDTPGASGIQSLALQAGLDRRARILLKARGAALARPVLPITALPVRAQLVNATGACWETALGEVRRNSAATFVATD
jgi:predicted acyl esterase